MGWIQDYRIKRAQALLGKSMGLRLNTVFVGGANPKGSQGFRQMVSEGYNANPDVRACLSELQSAIKSVKLVVKQRKRGVPDQDSEIKTDHPFYDLQRKPNPDLTWGMLEEVWLAHLFLAGSSFTKIVGPSVGPPTELWPIVPDTVELRRPGKGQKMGAITGFDYTYDKNKDPERIKVEDMVYQWFMNPIDPLEGLSPFTAAALGIDQGNTTRRWNLKLMTNGGVPPGFIQVPSEQSPETDQQRQKLEASIQEKIQSMRQSFADGEMSWEQLGLSPQQLQWIEGIALSTRDICKITHVPPEVLGESDQKTYSNFQEGRQSLYTEGALPLLDCMLDSLNMRLMPRFGDDVFLTYNIDDIPAMQENQKDKWARITPAKFMMINEKRRELGMGDVDGGDVFVFAPTDLLIAESDLATYSALPEPEPVKPDDDDNTDDDDNEPDEDEKSLPFGM